MAIHCYFGDKCDVICAAFSSTSSPPSDGGSRRFSFENNGKK